MSLTIFAAPDFLVRYVKAGGGPNCVVSFSSFTDDPRLDRPGFGESFLRDRGIDALHVINRTNVWYQYSELPAALQQIGSITQSYARTLTYGSSMGGYGAIRFAAAIGAQTAIAISPQFSVSPKAVPFEKRWRALARNIDFAVERTFEKPGAITPLVFYDPKDADALHFNLIARAYPMTKGIRLWHAGHPASAYLAETGLLTKVVTEIIDGKFDPAAFEKEARILRRASGQYFFTLARRLAPWHADIKRRLSTAATRVNDDAAYRIYLSMLSEASGELENAENDLIQADSMLPGHPIPLRAHCVFLLRRSRFAEAIPLARKLTLIDPARTEYYRLLRGAMFGDQDYANMIRGMHEYCSRAPPALAAAVAHSRFGSKLVELVLRASRRLVVLRLNREIRLEKELDLVEEWRGRRPRKRRGMCGLLS